MTEIDTATAIATSEQPVTAISPSEKEVYEGFARERGLRLARLLGYTFSGVMALILVCMGIYGAIHPQTLGSSFIIMGLILVTSIGIFFLAIHFTRSRRGLLAALLVIGGIAIDVIAFQVLRELSQGLDSIVVACFGFDVVIIGISGVLADTRIMFIVTTIMTVITTVICLVLPPAHSIAQTDALVTGIIVIVVTWTVALLYFAASSFYDQTLHELGTFREALVRAQKLDDLKNQFINNVNHELRNPIMALYNYIDVMNTVGDDMQPVKRASLLEKAVKVGDRVLYLITSILDTRRLDEGAANFTPETVSVHEMITVATDMIDPHEAKAVERDLHITLPEHLQIWGDRVRFQQILTNLLSNAIKYSPPGTPVIITGEVVTETTTSTNARGKKEKTHRQMVELIVRDQGLGIPPDQKDLLFQRFVRLPRDLESSTIGNGLGLHLCRVLAEAMGGRIWVESSGVPGEGSGFYLRLPLPPPMAAPSAEELTTAPATTQAGTLAHSAATS